MFNSQIGQDEWVAKTTKYKSEGYFLDIGCGHPFHINNTYYLEKQLSWRGMSIDIGPPHTESLSHISIEQYNKLWISKRKTPLIISDALTMDFIKTFTQHSFPNIIDYLSIDLDPPTATLKALLRLPMEKYRFNLITFETDYYRDKSTREKSREFLESHGYKLLVSGVVDYDDVGNSYEQEDWYVHKDFEVN